MNLITSFEALKSQVEAYASPALEIKVASTVESADAMLVVREIENLKKSVESKRKELVAPLNALVKEINDYAKEIMAPLLGASTHIRSQLIGWEKKLEQKRREALIELQKEKDKIELFGTDFTDEIILKSKENKIKETRVSGTHKVWTFEITDESLVPRLYCTPDQKLIRAAVVDHGHRDIPGVKIQEETRITIRS